MEFLDVVDENDEVMEKATKEHIYSSQLTHRIVHIFVFNENNEILLQKRQGTKSFPLYWAPSAGGHVASGETYEEAAQRELKEELYLEGQLDFISKIVFHGKVYPTGEPITKFISIFSIRNNNSFKKNFKANEEVRDVKFFSKTELKELLATETIHPELKFIIEQGILDQA